MPELPEVQTIVAALARPLAGRSITRVTLNRDDIITPRGLDFPSRITGQRITAVTRRGKRIVFTLDNGDRFYIHLGMTGRLTLYERSRAPEPHTHLILELDGRDQLHFRDPRRFGGIFWLGDSPPDGDLGPEPLTLTPARLGKLLAATSRPIKSALLDQRLIAGLGNIYADESLHAAGIHPLTPADRLAPEQIAKLNRAIKSVLRRAIRHRGSTLRDYRDAAGQAGAFQKVHRVYARDGLPCLTCGTTIRRIVLSGRSTCFCPKCQPESCKNIRRLPP